MNRVGWPWAVTLALFLLVLWLGVAVTADAASPPTRCYPAGDFDYYPQPVRADVDRDGIPDTISTTATWIDARSCTASVTLQTQNGIFTQQVGAPTFPLLAPPPVAALVPLRHGAALTVALHVWQGAATRYTQLFQLRRGRLVLLDPQPFAFAGSVTHRSGIDCVHRKRAVVVSSAAQYNGKGYSVTRRFYGLRGSRLVLRPALTRRYRLPLEALERRFHEFATVPFPRCAVLRPTP